FAQLATFGAEQARVMERKLVDMAQKLGAAGDEVPVGLRGDDKTRWHRKPALREDGEIRAFAAAQFEPRGQGLLECEGVVHLVAEAIVGVAKERLTGEDDPESGLR